MRRTNNKNKEQELRDKAEEILKNIAKDNNISFPRDLKRILHELPAKRKHFQRGAYM